MTMERLARAFTRQWMRWLGLLLSAGCIYWVLKDVQINHLLQIMRSVQLGLFTAGLLLGCLSLLVRAVRWKVLLAAEAQSRTKSLFTSLMIGYLANNLLPARMGELVRVYVLERRTGISKSAALASILLERLADVLVLLVLIGMASTFVKLPPLIVSGCWAAVIALFFIILVLGLLSGRSTEQTQCLVGIVGRWVPRYNERLQTMVDRFVAGLRSMRSGNKVAVSLLLTLLTWGLEIGWAWLVARALGLNLPWLAAVLMVTVIGIGSVLPAAPGSVGTYEFFAILALSPFSVDSTAAVAMAFLLHLSSYFLVATLGIMSIWIENTGEAGFLPHAMLRDVKAS